MATIIGFGPFSVLLTVSLVCIHICLFVLGLLVATIIGFGPFCVLKIASQPGFCLHTDLFVCSGADGGQHHWVWPLLCFTNCKSPGFCLQTHLFVCSGAHALFDCSLSRAHGEK